MVVLVLVSMVVGVTVVGLDGFSGRGRLRSALGQIASLDGLARTQAVCSGQPRQLSFARGTARCALRQPEEVGGVWGWSAAAPFVFGDGVAVRQVLVEGETPAGQAVDGRCGVRIRPDGTSQTYAVVLGVGDFAEAAVLIRGFDGTAEYVFDVPTEQSALLRNGERE